MGQVMTTCDESENIREVYARFGLAIYCAQVLEHGLVNAMVVLDLIPSRRHLAQSSDEWAAKVDDFMGRHFMDTMGLMIRSLQSVTPVSEELKELLQQALRRRNWLVHHFFREHAAHFMAATGRAQMLSEIDECRALFELADRSLEATVRPLRHRAGISDELVARKHSQLLAEQRGKD